jgi:hypothetical protein
MDPSEIHNFENQWKKAFDKASETPPPSVWDHIEARLDRDENDIVPLWWRTPKLWYAAASIIALLVIGGGYFFNNASDGTRNGSQNQTAVQAPGTESEKGNGYANGTPELAEGNIPDTDVQGQPLSVAKSDRQRKNAAATNARPSGKPGVNSTRDVPPMLAADTDHTEKNQNDVANKQLAGNVPEAMAVNKETSAPAAIQPELPIAKEQKHSIELAELTGVPVGELDVFFQKRYVFYKSEPAKEEALPELKQKGEYWAGIGLMPATFNPNVQIKEAPATFYDAQNFTTQNSRQQAATGTSKAGNSYAVQTQGGMKLSKHWSLEMGLNYLKGNSSYEGGGYVLNASNARSANMLEDALVNLSTSKSGVQDSPVQSGVGGPYEYLSGNALYIDVNRNVSNNYQYLQLPLQAGFTLNPDKKLSYSVLGGMMANFFLSNELESASGQTIRTTASDEVYRSMNWAATTGLRFNYRLSERWKASLMGSYQKAVSSGFKANQSLESHPYLYGISWGMRYSF